MFRGAIANLMVLAYDGPFHEIFSGEGIHLQNIFILSMILI